MSIQPIPLPFRTQDLTGMKFGRLTVLAYAGQNNHKASTWHVRCDCGNERIVMSGKLKSGSTKTCRSCILSLPDDQYRQYIKDKLLASITETPSGCWEWAKSRNRSGYGFMWCWKRSQPTHRISYLLFNGEFDRSLLVCHKCDNPPCCNPSHLFLGTLKDNAHDMIAKGRHHWQTVGTNLRCNKGGRVARMGRKKLTREQVAAIRKMLPPRKHTVKSVAQMFGVARSTIQLALKSAKSPKKQ